MLRDQGAKTLLKNRSVARLLKARKGAYVLNREELAEAPKYDGIWVVRTNTELDPKDVALRYKQLWMVERTFRTAKSLLDTRPVFHQTDDAIRGHMFCSFLALTLQKALFERLEQAELQESWNDIVRDLRAVTETQIEQDHKRLAVRSRITERAAGVFRAVGLRIPPVIRQLPRRTQPAVTHRLRKRRTRGTPNSTEMRCHGLSAQTVNHRISTSSKIKLSKMSLKTGVPGGPRASSWVAMGVFAACGRDAGLKTGAPGGRRSLAWAPRG